MDPKIRETFISKVEKYRDKKELKLIKKAYDFAEKAHAHQKRASGEPFFIHPVEVAKILVNYNLDTASIAAALLHDTVEDTDTSIETIEKEFGDDVALLVDGVTKLEKMEFKSDSEKTAENFRKLLFALSKDIRVLFIKLADRLHNLRTLKHKPVHKREKTAKESLLIYAPLAERIGIRKIQSEIEDIVFNELHPKEREDVIKQLREAKHRKKNVIEKVVWEITKKLKMEEGIECVVYGREKRPYSIWQKMERKHISFDRIYDLIAFRVVVDDLVDCYRALGIVNSNYKMIPGKFKDYISSPKENGYQSLHTVVIGPYNIKIEVQIRTKEMQRIAEFGVASHWAYKQGIQDNFDIEQYRWIKELMEMFEKTPDSASILKSNSKINLHRDNVFCFTPKGDIFKLPKGATAVDFAYAIHSKVGDECKAVKINGTIAPLRMQLKNGDEVEVITAKNASPSLSWLEFVVTSKARSSIKFYIRTQKRHEYIKLGQSMLQSFFESEGLEFNDVLVKKALKSLGKSEVDDVYSHVGEGVLSRIDVLKVLYPEHQKEKEKERKKESLLSKLMSPKKPHQEEKIVKKTTPISGLVPGIAVKFAKCCRPIPGDSIVGVVNTGVGVTIHKTNCKNLIQFENEPDRILDVDWKSTDLENDKKYSVKLHVSLANKPGSFAKMVNIIASKEINIQDVSTVNQSADYSEVDVSIEVSNKEELNDLVYALRMISEIYMIERG